MSKNTNARSDEEMRQRIIDLGFDSDEKLFQEFCHQLINGLPEKTGVALRGSVVTDERYEDGLPFDAEGRGTSDLDVTLIGDQVMQYWVADEFYIPGLHTKPLSDKTPEVAPALNPLRQRLQQLVNRPVNFQATANLVLFAREVLMNQPYVIIIEPGEKS